jgi:NADH-quinone oxidoreductase subunit N
MEIFILVKIAIVGFLLLLKSFNIIIFFISFELQTFCLYGLALLKKNSLTSNESGVKYFITGALISSIFILGSSFCYGFYGSLNFLELKIITEEKNLYFNFYSLCFITIIFYKLGLFPLGQ